MAEIVFAQGASRSAWASAILPISAPASGGGTGVGIGLREDVEIVSLLIGNAGRPEVASRLSRRLGLELPGMGRVSKAGATVIVGTAPAHWTVLRSGEKRSARPLAAVLTDVAERSGFVVDQAGGRALLRVSGTDVGRLLRKGCPIDLHPSVFETGHAASTVIEHIAAQIWRADRALAYDIMIARGHADDFAHWLTVGAAEFGYSVSGS